MIWIVVLGMTAFVVSWFAMAAYLGTKGIQKLRDRLEHKRRERLWKSHDVIFIHRARPASIAAPSLSERLQ